jgi:hypothetical protein
LQQAYDEDAMGRAQVFDWFRRFKEVGASFESYPRSETNKIKIFMLLAFLRVYYEGIVHR